MGDRLDEPLDADPVDLVARFRAGDEQAVRDVYARYGGALRSVARAVLGQPELVAEAVQETMLKAWRAAGTFDSRAGDGAGFASWLYAIARNTAIDIARREHRPTTGDHAPEVDPPIAAVGMERTWEVFEVRRAVDALPDIEREVVRLSHRDGLTHEQIARHLGIPLGTVKSRSGRAHRRLAAALAHLAPATPTPIVETIR